MGITRKNRIVSAVVEDLSTRAAMFMAARLNAAGIRTVVVSHEEADFGERLDENPRFFSNRNQTIGPAEAFRPLFRESSVSFKESDWKEFVESFKIVNKVRLDKVQHKNKIVPKL